MLGSIQKSGHDWPGFAPFHADDPNGARNPRSAFNRLYFVDSKPLETDLAEMVVKTKGPFLPWYQSLVYLGGGF
jgi:hypothetical protein